MSRARLGWLMLGLAAVLAARPAAACAGADPPALTDEERRLIAAVDAGSAEALALLEKAVNIPSATLNLEGVRAVGAVFGEELQRIGFATEWAAMPDAMRRAGHLVARREGTRGRRVLLIGHLDTVLEGDRFERDGDRARGSGTVDMKAGDVIIVQALKALHAAGALEDRTVIVVLTGDEEDAGIPLERSRAALRDAARRSDLALGFEAAVGQTATVARRGVSSWRLEVHARTGHSQGILGPGVGAGAIFETARILEGFRAIPDGDGLTLNPSVITGGTTAALDAVEKRGTAEGKSNVVPAEVVVEGDLRFVSPQQRDEAVARMRRIAAENLPHTMARLEIRDEYPAMAPTAGNDRLLSELSRASEDLGLGKLVALDPRKRGAGDVSFVAEFVPCLDGLGARGDHAHAAGEDVDLATLPEQVRRAALLIYRMTR